MKEISVTSKKLHQLSTPIKVSFEVCLKISSHDGLQTLHTINMVDIGPRVFQRRCRVAEICVSQKPSKIVTKISKKL